MFLLKKIFTSTFNKRCAICGKVATNNTFDVPLGSELTFDRLHPLEMQYESVLSVFHLCAIHYEEIKIESEEKIIAQKKKEEKWENDLIEAAEQARYEKLKRAVETKELENKARELGIDISSL